MIPEDGVFTLPLHNPIKDSLFKAFRIVQSLIAPKLNIDTQSQGVNSIGIFKHSIDRRKDACLFDFNPFAVKID